MSGSVAKAAPQSLFKEFLASVGTSLHCWGLLWSVHCRRGCRSYYARVNKTGELIELSYGFHLDGTDFLVEDQHGSILRMPSSEIHGIEDKGDWGY